MVCSRCVSIALTPHVGASKDEFWSLNSPERAVSLRKWWWGRGQAFRHFGHFGHFGRFGRVYRHSSRFGQVCVAILVTLFRVAEEKK